jgi:hypothetical protein
MTSVFRVASLSPDDVRRIGAGILRKTSPHTPRDALAELDDVDVLVFEPTAAYRTEPK